MHNFQKTLENWKLLNYNSATGSFSYGKTDFASQSLPPNGRGLFALEPAMPNKHVIRRWQQERQREPKPVPTREQIKRELGIYAEEYRREEEERATIKQSLGFR
jgi:hypothetical protein